MKVLVLGASGMLGNAIFHSFSKNPAYQIHGVCRNLGKLPINTVWKKEKILCIEDIMSREHLYQIFNAVKPDVVINCIGIVKQLNSASDPLQCIPINSILPYMLADLCQTFSARLVHFSTDCVFSGKLGNYHESDFPDAKDLYGRSKLLGEVEYDNSITLRTSIIGRELNSAHSLLDWFLSQEHEVKGYRRAIFSGLPTTEIAKLLEDKILPNKKLSGLFHLSAEPINKYELLKYCTAIFDKKISITPDDTLVVDRSLNSNRLREEISYTPPSWPELLRDLKNFYKGTE
ncbi:dTDP-4-dehydrorhamnose reductase family protein [Chromobacterium violaceum]|uniref:dTDP-4-dehydrorhamnose reductase n=1 Tax=Chromobacterium violaceum TaxID=536 RepID=A0AAX2MHA2_CHRVL|nr:SDR family oxidoreductase [Chromobacterium violaceum]OLZ77879.1 NAD(P)-dependent oxidoreductase [Chromobacterium violaceum]STB69279.1 dTDP-4-dehydrorhamnose reductase [Chromobacterium violaceum]SUY93459.1 dTDP-4-dehydrorhamnose reductase [Chromobacterium violaceum]